MDSGEKFEFGCIPGKFVRGGISRLNCSDDIIMFVNVGDETQREVDSKMKLVSDANNHSGNSGTLVTTSTVLDAGDYPFVYQSVRYGFSDGFRYRFDNLPPGYYLVDLHFVYIGVGSGPFNVFIQDDKVLSEFILDGMVGAQKPLQLVDCIVWVKCDGVLSLRFENIVRRCDGVPLSGICIKRPSNWFESWLKQKYIRCPCGADIEVPLTLARDMEQDMRDKYEDEYKGVDVEISNVLCEQLDKIGSEMPFTWIDNKYRLHVG